MEKSIVLLLLENPINLLKLSNLKTKNLEEQFYWIKLKLIFDLKPISGNSHEYKIIIILFNKIFLSILFPFILFFVYVSILLL